MTADPDPALPDTLTSRPISRAARPPEGAEYRDGETAKGIRERGVRVDSCVPGCGVWVAGEQVFRWVRRRRDPRPEGTPADFRWCGRCRAYRHPDRFGGGTRSHRWCRGCTKSHRRQVHQVEKGIALAEDVEAYRLRNIRAGLRRNYGMSLEEYERILARQGGVCAICGDPPRERRDDVGGRKGSRGRLVVDHDHVTGATRGLLCGTCNTGLGGFRDCPETLGRAIRYLNVHGLPLPGCDRVY